MTEPAGFMGWMTGFEPATSGSTIRRSNQLSYTHHEGSRNKDINKGLIVVATGLYHPLASKADCISARMAATVADGSAASRMGRPITR